VQSAFIQFDFVAVLAAHFVHFGCYGIHYGCFGPRRRVSNMNNQVRLRMAHRPERLGARTAGRTMNTQTRENHQFGQTASARGRNASVGMAEAEIARAAGFLAELCLEIDTTLDPTTPTRIST
jgi:hypothetical protein